MKKIIAILLIFFISNFIFLPALAQNEHQNTNHIIDAEFKTDLNVNKTSKGQIVQFISTEEYKINNFIIPKGTIFEGEVKHFKKGRFGYRRAKVVIKLNKMILPDSRTCKIQGTTKRHVLKGSAMGNVGKGIISLPPAIAVGAVGACVIIVEAVSIVGIVAIGPTTYAFGRALGSLTHGINYKKHQGDEIKLKIKAVETP